MTGHTVSAYSRRSLREALEMTYDCKYVGQLLAPPYTDQDDIPDQFRTPDGRVFNVPQPSAKAGKYYQWVVDDVISDNKLQIINTAYIVSNNAEEKDAVAQQ